MSESAATGCPAATTFNSDFPGLDAVDWVGFDLDHALVRYKVPDLMELVYTALTSFLVDDLGYPAAVLKQPFDPSFIAKGVVYEVKSGNFLTLTSTGRIVRATHGTRQLTDLEIVSTWNGRVWPGFATLKKHTKHPSFMVFMTYFDMPALLIVARLVDYCTKEAKPLDFVPDLFKAFNHEFDPTSFEKRIGLFFPTILSNPDKYLAPRPGLCAWLHRLRANGQRTFLATNSHVGFAQFLLNHVFGPSYAHMFDVLVYNAQKPGFFYRMHPFLAFNEERRAEGGVATTLSTDPLKKNLLLCRGNAVAIQHLADALKLSKADNPVLDLHVNEEGAVFAVHDCDDQLDCDIEPIVPTAEPNPDLDHTVALGLLDGVEDFSAKRAVKPGSAPHATFAYVGDHIHGDVLSSRRALGWHAVAVVEELEVFRPDERLGNTAVFADAGALPASVGTPQFSPSTWGDFFAGPSAHDPASYFANMLSHTACLAVSDVALLEHLYPLPQHAAAAKASMAAGDALTAKDAVGCAPATSHGGFWAWVKPALKPAAAVAIAGLLAVAVFAANKRRLGAVRR